MGCGCAKKKNGNKTPSLKSPSSKSSAKGMPIIAIRRSKKVVPKKINK